MRGSNVSDATGEDLENDVTASSSELMTLSSDWLNRLMGTVALDDGEAMPLPRSPGGLASMARWIGLAARGRARGDEEVEREACWWLASQLAGSDWDLRLAINHARRALELGGEEAWRIQVSTWLERVGQHEGAAAVLAPSVNQAATAREAARLLVRMARMQVRADEHALAMKNLLEAATVWPAYAEALDQAGELAAAQGMVDAPTMFLEAADRHEQNGNRARAFESRRRAFETAPASAQACDALAETLEQTERFDAADGVRRAHAAASDEARARTTHAARLSRAIEASDEARALAAVIDGVLETATQESFAGDVDEALSRAGLHDAVAARWEWSTSQTRGPERARIFVALAGLYLGRLASPDRAIDAWIEAIGADPSCEAARTALRTHARSMHDQTALAEALIRAVQAHPDGHAAIECLRELATLAEERLSEPSLAQWAYAELAKRGVSDESIDKARSLLGPRVRLQDSALAAAERAVEAGDAETKIDGRRRIAAILRGRPDEAERYLDVLAELVRSGQSERRWWVDFERIAVRMGRLDSLEEVTRERLGDGIPRPDILHFRMNLLAHAWRRGDTQAVLRDALALAQELPGTRAAHAHAWIAATITGQTEQRALALEHISANLTSSVRATLLALAGEMRVALGQDEESQRLAKLACKADGSTPRVLLFLASRDAADPSPSFARTAEKLSTFYLPDHDHHAKLVATFSNHGDHELAHAWARRWLDLRPWDIDVLARLIDTAAATSTVDMHVAALMRATTCPLSFERIEPLLCRGVEQLAERDVPRAAQVARDLCDLFGVRRRLFRDTLLSLAATAKDPRFEARILERWMADHDEAAAEIWLRLSHLYEQLEEREAGARCLARAASVRGAPQDVLSRAVAFEPATSGDAALSILEARARVYDALAESTEAEQSTETREKARLARLTLGAALWERADDPIGAIRAWLPVFGDDAVAFAKLADSLAKFTSPELAAEALRDFALHCDDPFVRASALVVASARAHAVGQFRTALDLALLALQEDPRRTDALLIVEQASARGSVPEAMDRAHALAAGGAKGRFGRRAAHLRAARTLESRNYPELAIVHAIAAFEADPIEGSALLIMLRLATRVEATEVVDTLCRVAEAASREGARAHWWMLAARVAANDPDHLRRALDLALRALLAAPSVETIRLLDEVMGRLITLDPEDAGIFEVRLRRASKALGPKLEGPVGGRIAIAAASLSARVLQSPSLAMEWATMALACSGDIDEHNQLIAFAGVLSRESELCERFIDEVVHRSRGLSGTTGPALFAFARSLAQARGDEPRLSALAQEEAKVAESQATEADPFADLAEDLSTESDRPGASDASSTKESEAPAERQARKTLRPGSRSPTEEQPSLPEAEGSHEVPPATARGLGSLEPARPTQPAQQEQPEPARKAEPQPEPREPAEFTETASDIDPLRVAKELSQSGDIDGAIQILERYEPSKEFRPRVDELLRKLYEASGRNSKLPVVLERIAQRAEDPETKIQLLVETAKLREARGEKEGARATWQIVTELDPTHREAWIHLEHDASDRSEFVMLAQILQRRSMVSDSVAETRELRLRRAYLMDRELGLPDQARAELDSLLEDHGADVSVLRYRAELAERSGGPLTAAPFWVRTAAILPSRADAVTLLCKAAEAYMESGFHEQARETLALAGDARPPRLVALLVDIERRSGANPTRMGSHLEELAEIVDSTEPSRAEWLLEAAAHAMTAGDVDAGVERARRAATFAPTNASIQLRATFLIYRLEGLGNRDRVVEMLDRLRTGADTLKPEELDLHAFLTAECLEVLEGPMGAIDYLHERKRNVGIGPLIALALADRLAVTGDPQASLPLFDITLRAEDLRGVRTRAQVAFAAARAALRAGGSQLAAPYVSLVEQQPGAEQMVERLRTEMAEIVPATDEVRRQLDRLARTSRGIERAKALQQLARLSASRGTRASNAEAEGYYVEAMAAAASDPEVRIAIHNERDAFRGRLTPSMLPPPVAATHVVTLPPAPRTPSFGPSAASAPPPMPLSPIPSSPPPRTSDSPPPKRPDSREPSLTSTLSSQPPPPQPLPSPLPPRPSPFPSDPDRERALFEALAQGDMEAGDQLASILTGEPTRSVDLVAIRRRQVVLQPHSLRYLELLRDAARADRNPAYAAAVHHVIYVLSGQTPSPPPPLQGQIVDPQRILAMVGRGIYGPAAEVLGEVWTNASHLFVREPAAFGLTGLERVAFSSPSPVARAYASAAPVLGLGKTPVFHRRSRGPMSLAVAALSPMSVVVTGEVEDGPELDYRMGAMLLAATPPNAMLFGLPSGAVQQLMKALLAAFGPPDASRNRMSESAVLAAELWRALPGSVQRRFGQLYRDSAPFTYEDAWARALQATRRAGLFVVGDLAVAMNDVLSDPGNREGVDGGAPDAYRALCRVSVSAADLVRFASSAEFAEVRWREVRQRSSGNMRSVQA
jgi:tetratricopeptide (TPR) repeat protein